MEMTLILTILGRLLPVLYERISKGEEWRNIKLGDVENWKPSAELKKQLKGIK